MKISEEWADKSVEAVRTLELFRNGEVDTADMIFGGGIGVFEHVVHELSHAATLGIVLSAHTSEDVSAVLGHERRHRVTNEAMTFACEAIVLTFFGLIVDENEYSGDDDRITMTDIFNAAEVQGCTHEEVSHWLCDDEIGMAAEKVMEWLSHPRFPTGLLEEDEDVE